MSKNENEIQTQTKNQNETQNDLFGNPVISKRDNVYENKSSKKKEQRDLSGALKIEYVLEIVCNDATEQENFYNELIKRGFTCRILTL